MSTKFNSLNCLLSPFLRGMTRPTNSRAKRTARIPRSSSPNLFNGQNSDCKCDGFVVLLKSVHHASPFMYRYLGILAARATILGLLLSFSCFAQTASDAITNAPAAIIAKGALPGHPVACYLMQGDQAGTLHDSCGHHYGTIGGDQYSLSAQGITWRGAGSQVRTDIDRFPSAYSHVSPTSLELPTTLSMSYTPLRNIPRCCLPTRPVEKPFHSRVRTVALKD